MDKLGRPAPVSVIGMDDGGLANLGMAATRELFSADVIYTSRRLAALLPEHLQENCRLWPSPFALPAADIVARREAGDSVAVLLSGNPFWHGAGPLLADAIPAGEMQVYPAPSAFSLAAARMGWALQEVETFSAHGRPVQRLELHLRPRARLLVLTQNETSPLKVARLLIERGFGQSRMSILANLGGAAERRIHATAQDVAQMDEEDIPPLHVLAIEVMADDEATILPLTPGLADDAFLHDGQITKQTIRAVTVCALAPLPGQLLWDVGAGNGTVCVEWVRATRGRARAIAIERDMARCARITENARRLGALDIEVIEGSAPAALDGLEQPDAIFIGGNAGCDDTFNFCLKALKSGGILVANAVTTQGEAALHERHRRLGGDLVRLDVSHAAPLGGGSAMRPALPVTQLRLRKQA